jgi:hypothetical protein
MTKKKSLLPTPREYTQERFKMYESKLQRARENDDGTLASEIEILNLLNMRNAYLGQLWDMKATEEINERLYGVKK